MQTNNTPTPAAIIEALKAALAGIGALDASKIDPRRFAAIERGLIEAIGAATLLYSPQDYVIAPAHLQADLTRLKYAGIAASWSLTYADQLIALGFAEAFTYEESVNVYLTARGRYSGTVQEIEEKNGSSHT